MNKLCNWPIGNALGRQECMPFLHAQFSICTPKFSQFYNGLDMKSTPCFVEKLCFALPVSQILPYTIWLQDDVVECLFNWAILDHHWPSSHHKSIQLCDVYFRNINLGVYKAGFAKTQEDYDAGVKTVFIHMEKVMYTSFLYFFKHYLTAFS